MMGKSYKFPIKMNDDKNPVDDHFPSESLDSHLDDTSDVAETDIDRIADEMAAENANLEDEDEVPLSTFHEEGDDVEDMNGDAEHIIDGRLDEDTE